MKGIDILLDPQTGDLMASTARNAAGLIDRGLEIGDTTWQNQAVILQAFQGEFKEFPTLGVGISNLLGDNEMTGWKREIALQLEADDMKVREVDIDIANKKLVIDAVYRS